MVDASQRIDGVVPTSVAPTSIAPTSIGPTSIGPTWSSALDRLRAWPAPQALLFDLDGTLVDSVEDIFVSTNALMSELALPPRTRDEVSIWIGNGARMLVERAIAGRFEGFADDINAATQHARADAAMARFRAIYQEACVRHTVPLRGAHDCLAHAHARGLGIAIVTNKPLAPTQRIIDALGWRAFVSAVVAGDSPSVRKPDPAPLVEALRQLDATHAWMIGDSANDVGAARAAGMPSVVVRGGYNHGNPVESLHPAPEVILDSLESLPALVDGITVASSQHRD